MDKPLIEQLIDVKEEKCAMERLIYLYGSNQQRDDTITYCNRRIGEIELAMLKAEYAKKKE